jgi:WD40 repeat protein
VLVAASLELKAEKQSAHSDVISSVAFSPDGATIVSGSYDQTIKVWGLRPFDASEWEEVDISGMKKDKDGEVKIEGLGYVGSNYWRNKVTGDLRKEYSTAGARLGPRTDQSLGCRHLSPPYSSPSPKLSTPTLATASLELKAEKQSAHSKAVASVAFSPDGSTIVSGSYDQTIKVWDAGTLARHIHHSAQN